MKVTKESCLQWLYRAWSETQASVTPRYPLGKIIPTKWKEIPAYSTLPTIAFSIGVTSKSDGIKSPRWADLSVLPDMEMAGKLYEAYGIYSRACQLRAKANQEAAQKSMKLDQPVDNDSPDAGEPINNKPIIPVFLRSDPIIERLDRIEISLQEQHSELAALNQGVNELLKEWSEDEADNT